MAIRHTRSVFHQAASAFLRPTLLVSACAVALLLGVVLAWSQAADVTPRNPLRGETSDADAANDANSTSDTGPGRRKPFHRIREGTELTNQLGSFIRKGDRVIFVTDDSRRQFAALENLALERVAATMTEDDGQRQWEVTGQVTEYHGGNFLLIRRAILTNSSQPKSSDR